MTMRERASQMLQRTIKPAVLALLLLSPAARAQEVALPEPVAPSTGGNEPEIGDVNREIDLANVVTSAAKGVTTVQEAPAIITIITAEDIKARGFKWINEALQTVPGWMEASAVGNQYQNPLVRGVSQAALLLHDGISMFDPYANLNLTTRSHALENVKRIEIVTGPGGVLWGANSFLGIVNVISKDAEDVPGGFELNAGYGDGPGNKQNFRAYGMFGKSFWKGRIKLFQHVSYESYIGTVFDLPSYVASSPAPQPPGPSYFGKVISPEPDRSWLVTVDGKYTFGPVSLYYQVPFGDQYRQLTFSNTLVSHNQWSMYDRYAILEYKDRFLKDRFGITVKGYWSQFVRSFSLQVFPGSSLFPPFTDSQGRLNQGGLHFDFSGTFTQRAVARREMHLILLP
jgi:outer membrane receptor protein involved in Fe transport